MHKVKNCVFTSHSSIVLLEGNVCVLIERRILGGTYGLGE
jgi:hypothetical protein